MHDQSTMTAALATFARYPRLRRLAEEEARRDGGRLPADLRAAFDIADEVYADDTCQRIEATRALLAAMSRACPALADDEPTPHDEPTTWIPTAIASQRLAIGARQVRRLTEVPLGTRRHEEHTPPLRSKIGKGGRLFVAEVDVERLIEARLAETQSEGIPA